MKKIQDIFIEQELLDMQKRADNKLLTKEEVSKKSKIISEKGTPTLKYYILNKIFGLSKDVINELVLSTSYNDGLDVLQSCFKHIDELYESTENYLIGEYLKIEVCFGNIGFLYNDLLEINLRESSIKMIAEKFSKSDDVVILKWCLCEKKFKPYYNLFIQKISEIGSNDDLFEVLHYNSSSLEEGEVSFVLEQLSKRNGKKELCRIINKIDSKYFGYIMTLLEHMDNLLVEDIKYIPTDKLGPTSRHILTNLYCRLGTSENISYYIKQYSKYFDEYDYKLVVKRLCELKDKDALIKLFSYTEIEPYYDDIFEVLSQIEGISYNDIEKIDFITLSKDNKAQYVDIACKTSTLPSLYQFVLYCSEYLDNNHIDKIVGVLCEKVDAEYVYWISRTIKTNLSPDNISDLANALSKTNSAEYMYKFAIDIKNLSKNDISILVKSILKTNDIEYIYLFLKNVSNIKKEDKKLLKSKILSSHNMKFICLGALYIDTKLIKKLFNDKKTMYRYMVSSNLFSKEDLFEVSLEMFGGDIDTNLIESQVQEEVGKINAKKYKMTIKEELNKKYNKKDNK